MLCPFLKTTDYYDYSGTKHLEKEKAHIQVEDFHTCRGSQCMAYSAGSCKLIEKKN